MRGARWVLLGALLAGCVFTPRPMIPASEDDADADMTGRGGDAAVSLDSPAPRDLGAATDRGVVDTTPPEFDVGASADTPGVTTPDAGAFFDAGGAADTGTAAFDAPAPGDACDGGDGGEGGCPLDASADAGEADATADATVDAGADAGDGDGSDAGDAGEAGLGAP